MICLKKLCKASHNIFKESKGLLRLGKCQSSNFAAQIAGTTLVALQYNILAAAITKVFSVDDEEVLNALVNESDELAHICKLYQCKMAS